MSEQSITGTAPAAAEAGAQVVSINGVQYNAADLSDVAKSQIVNLRVTDQEIAHLQQRLAIAQTARVAYANALAAELPRTGSETEH